MKNKLLLGLCIALCIWGVQGLYQGIIAGSVFTIVLNTLFLAINGSSGLSYFKAVKAGL